MPQRLIYDAAPLRIYWETTNACDLACRHCRAEAAPEADPRELSTTEGRALLEALRGFGSPLPHLVFTGGDPLKRADLFELIDHARGLGFHVSVAPSATPLLTEAAIGELAAHGVDAISLSLDAATAERHDAIRQVPGTFERTLRAAAAARAAGLPFQVNTLVCEETADDLPRIHEIVRELGAARWSLFFLVTVGRGNVLAPVTPERAEEILSWIAGLSSARMATGRGGLVITTTEAPQIRRVVAERMKAARPGPEGAADAGSPPPPRGHATHAGGVRDGNGILFISNVGDICPSGFLELPCGNVKVDDVVAVYRDAPLFRKLRVPTEFGGRCGRCEHALVCGGSRARAWSATGDPLAEDPLCTHEPGAPAPERPSDGSSPSLGG
ncbi:MAG: TIGR04053 family radical SAM/SPASM domain-containing protein [Polyangiaceae bacterium]|jgi:radical SAM protein|nr:TIGR04053 family radical SAM/SPASM domain-containing protein [Polyangiaceae bacterium]MBK8940023.1 TIGR04053 family radical SAM/SPASM domain-containing protein [Polyangiaceae bacterium]